MDQDQMRELLPCPFCGGEPAQNNMLGVWCNNDACSIVGQVFSGGAHHWNRRASRPQSAPDAQNGPIDANRLEEMAKERPDECFLKGSGVTKLLGAIRQLEGEVREAKRPQSALSDERATFERWYAERRDACDFSLRPDGQYDDWDIALQWNAWEARALLAQNADLGTTHEPQPDAICSANSGNWAPTLSHSAGRAPEGFVPVPVSAYLWLMGMGKDGFTEDRDGAFWWRGAFNDRAGLDMMEIYQRHRYPTPAPAPAPVSAGQADGWISVKDRLPDSSKNVLAYYQNSMGNSRRIRAAWIAAKTVESNLEDNDCDEYDDTTDAYYMKEGWYEQIDNWDEYSSVTVCEGDVTHWMPIPPAPAPSKER